MLKTNMPPSGKTRGKMTNPKSYMLTVTFTTALRALAFLAALLACSSCARIDPPAITFNLPAPSTPLPVSPLPFAGGSAQLTFASGGDIVQLDAGSREPQPLITSPAYENAPAWSPDGMRLAYTATIEDNEEIIIASADDPDYQANVTHNSRRDLDAAWSPDGRLMAFASDRGGDWGLYVGDVQQMNVPDGIAVVNPQRRTFNRFYDGHPAWSPDGTTIAYTSDRGIRWQIFTMDKFGGLQQPVPGTEQLRSTASPAWSPDGTRLAFAATIDGNWEIYTINVDGTNPRRLTRDPADDWDPAWSPDGAWIAFVSDRTGNGDLYLVPADSDGTEVLRLTGTPTTELAPAWRP